MIYYLPLFAQVCAMTIDEFYFHQRRGLDRWEKLGHPVDTFFFILCCALLVFHSGGLAHVQSLYIALSVLSCVAITKDEFVHKDACHPMEMWLHALLFVLHPVCLYALWMITESDEGHASIAVFFAGLILFFIYQILYWNFLRRTPHSGKISINGL
jgi:hypothetical protein